MSKKIVFGLVGGVAVAAACVGGIYMTGQTVDAAVPQLIAKANANGMVLTVEDSTSSFTSRTHKFSLLIDSEKFNFEQEVSLLPWGASAQVKLIQEGEVFKSLREESTFTNFPIDISWSAGAFGSSVTTTVVLEEVTIKEANSSSPDQVTIYPANLSLTVGSNGENFELNGFFDGFKFTDGNDEVIMGRIDSELLVQKVDGVFLSKNSKLSLADFHLVDKRHSGEIREEFKVKNAVWKDSALLGDNTVSFKESVDIASMSVMNRGDGFEMESLKLKLSLNDLSWKAMSSILANSMDLGYYDMEAPIAEFLEKGLGIKVDGEVKNFALIEDEERKEGSLAIKGEVSCSGVKAEELMFGPLSLLAKSKGEVNLQVTRSFVDAMANEMGIPYEMAIEQGYVAEEGDKLVTRLTLADGALSANDKKIPM